MPPSMRVRYMCGLSPPTRGIREKPIVNDKVVRSIPAYAGDPEA